MSPAAIRPALRGALRKGTNVETYSKFRPTGFDCAGLALDDQQDWLVAPCTVNRDSGVTSRANWTAQGKALEAFPGQYETHRFGHWACGWFEIVIVAPDSDAVREMQSLEDGLENYPIVNDEIHSALECEEVERDWANMSLKERVKLCQECRVDAMKARHEDSIPDECFSRLRDRLDY